MDEERPRKRHTKFSRAARAKRILEQLREGWAYDDIAREEGLTARRLRQIVAEFVKTRGALGDATHAQVQIERLSRAMRVASDALAQGEIRAIGPFIRVVDRLDRYQALAHETTAYPTPEADRLVFQQLVARIRRSVEDEFAEERRREAEAAAASAGSAAPEPIGNCAAAEAPAAAAAEASAPPPFAPLAGQAPSDFFRGIRP
jgi:hypothetical protein